jgi:hypothetical protein
VRQMPHRVAMSARWSVAATGPSRVSSSVRVRSASPTTPTVTGLNRPMA